MSDRLVYRNVMEALVAWELERQVRYLSAEGDANLDRGAVMAYALNRLPVRYAQCPEERRWHRDRVSRRLSPLIREVVGWALKTVLQHPRPVATSLPKDGTPETALLELERLLGCEDLTWENLAATIEATLVCVEWERIRKGRFSYGDATRTCLARYQVETTAAVV